MVTSTQGYSFRHLREKFYNDSAWELEGPLDTSSLHHVIAHKRVSVTLGWRGRGFQGQKSPVPGGLPAHSPSPIHCPKLKSSAWGNHWVQPSLPSLLFPSPHTQHSAKCTAKETKQPLGVSPVIPASPLSGPLSCSVNFMEAGDSPRTFPPFSSALDTTLEDAYTTLTLKTPPMAPPGKHVLHGPQPENSSILVVSYLLTALL